MSQDDLPWPLPRRIVLAPAPDDVGDPPAWFERQAHPPQGSDGIDKEHGAKAGDDIIEFIFGQRDFGIAAEELDVGKALRGKEEKRTIQAPGVKSGLETIVDSRLLFMPPIG